MRLLKNLKKCSNVCVRGRRVTTQEAKMNRSELLTRAKFHKHNGRMVLSLDFAQLGIEEAYEVINYSAGIVEKMPKNSICTLTNISGAKFNQDLIDALKKFAQKNKPHVIAGAVVGADGIKKTLFKAILKVTGRQNLKMFNNEEDALTWLTAQNRV